MTGAVRKCLGCVGQADWHSSYCGACKLRRKAAKRQYDTEREKRRRQDPAVRERQRLAAAERRARDPERSREINRDFHRRHRPHLKMYGISADHVVALTAAQNGRCAICHRPRDLGVDHSHVTGRVRGMLCGNCNRGLGMFGDSIEHLGSAIEYLSPFLEDLEPLALFQEPVCMENTGSDGEIESIDFCGGTISGFAS